MLTEEQRKRLDEIVGQMVANKEPDSSIEFVVNDFKNKYSVPEPDEPFRERAAKTLDAFFGGGKVGEAIGTAIAKSKATDEEKQFIEEGPTKKQVVGSALQSASLFAPIGTLAKGITGGVRALGLSKGASALGKVGSGALTGELFDVATNLQQGKVGREALTPGLGAVLGGGLPALGVAKNVAVRFGQGQAPRVINSLIKPLTKDFSYGKNPGRAVAEEGIVANNFDDLLTQIRARRSQVGQKIGEVGQKLSQEPVLSVRGALSPLDEAMKEAAAQNNQTLLSRLNNVKRAVTEILEPTMDDAGNLTIKSVGGRDLDNLTFQQVRNILSDVGELTSFTGNPSDDKLVNAALKQVYGKIKETSLEGARAINPDLAPEFEKLTEKYADLHTAEIATKYRDKIAERQNLISLNPTIAGFGTALVTAIATGGATIPAILAGLSGAALDKLASTPGFKTRLAYLLSKKTQREANFLFRKIPALSKFFSTKEGFAPGDILLGDFADDLEQGIAGFIKKPKLGLSIDDVSKKDGFTPKLAQIYNGEKDITTKTLQKLKGRSTVSKQFISDLTNNPDLKQAERDIIRRVLEDYKGEVPVKDFANKVKSELLPLKFRNRTSGNRDTRYESVNLPEDLRGPVAEYQERVYESPIKTSAGGVHFNEERAPNYFAHTRIEDLPDSLPRKGESVLFFEARRKANPSGEPTRRVIEIQSDLFQKGRLEQEKAFKNYSQALQEAKDRGFSGKEAEDMAKGWVEEDANITKLEPYRNTWHERVIREEVKKAAQDGKTKLQFPTGETAMKIEGLGGSLDDARFINAEGPRMGDAVRPDDLEIGSSITGNGGEWIITDVLGDGKFKAVPKDVYESYARKAQLGEAQAERLYNSAQETFDISGKVDTNNPIYKFYEKEVGRYLSNKYGAKRIKDAQGVEWYELGVKPEQGKMPIEAFAALPALAFPKKEEKKGGKRQE